MCLPWAHWLLFEETTNQTISNKCWPITTGGWSIGAPWYNSGFLYLVSLHSCNKIVLDFQNDVQPPSSVERFTWYPLISCLLIFFNDTTHSLFFTHKKPFWCLSPHLYTLWLLALSVAFSSPQQIGSYWSCKCLKKQKQKKTSSLKQKAP